MKPARVKNAAVAVDAVADTAAVAEIAGRFFE
jgi:hypothetical protein